ncbi:DUF6973 domain-containing protein [Mycolicibacterium nivoides]|uniref:DUF6973 domain-containing protein n=1 Tax=Mycolicibacterium nivoides TaxID=2487344 RepID=UPI003C2CFECB
MTESANADFAEQMGDAHEIGNWNNPERAKLQTVESTTMDFMNNRIGREVGLRHEGNRAEIVLECVTMAKNSLAIPKTAAALSAAAAQNKLVYFE